MSELSTYEYVGLQPPEAAQFDTLPERMSEIELEILLSGVNRESTCVALGLLTDKPQTSADLHSEFTRYGIPTDGYIDVGGFRQILDRLPTPLVQYRDGGFLLTPFGQVAQGAGGHLLRASLETDLPQQTLLSNNANDIDALDGIEKLTHIKRLYLVGELFKAGSDGTVSAEFRAIASGAGIGKGSYEATLYKLIEEGIIERMPIHRGLSTYHLSDEHTKYVATILDIIAKVAQRDEDFLAEGTELAKKIAHSADAPRLAARAIMARRYSGHDQQVATHDEIATILALHGPCTVFEIHQHVEERGRLPNITGLHSLRTTLGYIATHYAECGWGVLGKSSDNRTNVWGTLDSAAAPATPSADVSVR